MSAAPTPIVVLVSGRGSNMLALFREHTAGRLPVTFRAVISNRPRAPALDIARAENVPARSIDHRAFADREGFEQELAAAIDEHAPALIVLAGFMRILTDGFIARYRDRLLNIHPSLLPALPGLHTHERALAQGLTEHGATVHFVTPETDAGPPVLQARVPVLPDDDADSLAARVLRQEHRILPRAVRWFANGRLRFDGETAWLDGRPLEQPVIDTEALHAREARADGD